MNRRLVPTISLSLVLALSSLGAPQSQADETANGGQSQQAELLAQDLGVSEEVAAQWFEGEEEFLAALEHAKTEAGDQYFSSAWTPQDEATTGYKAWVAFKGEVPASVTKRFAQLPYPVEVRLDAKHTEAELEKIRYDLMTELNQAADLEGLTGNFTPEGGIEIEYSIADTETDPAAFEELVADVSEEAPVEVAAEETEDVEPVEEVVRGGSTIYGCTLAFTVTKGNTRGALTAGHCPNNAGVPGGGTQALKFVGEHVGVNGDIQYHTTGEAIRNQIRISNSGTTRNITGYRTGTNGSSVCNFGRTRASASCTTIRNANHAFYHPDGAYVTQMVQTNGWFTNPGDSGGPWYSGNSALGIHFGKSGGYSTYTKVGSALDYFGVRLAVR